MKSEINNSGEKYQIKDKDSIGLLLVLVVLFSFISFYLVPPSSYAFFKILLWIGIIAFVSFIVLINRKTILIFEDYFSIVYNIKRNRNFLQLPYTCLHEAHYHIDTVRGQDILKIKYNDLKNNKIRRISFNYESNLSHEILHFLISKNVKVYIDSVTLASEIFKVSEKQLSRFYYGFFALKYYTYLPGKKEEIDYTEW